MSTNPLIVTEQHVTEHAAHKFVTEASDLGLRPGQAFPERWNTELGNGQPLVLLSIDPQRAVYVQNLGCITLTVLND